MKRVVLAATVAVACLAATGPAWAVLSPPQQVNDLYAFVDDGKIYRLPGGTGMPQLELNLGTYEGEWIEYDPGADKFVVGPHIHVPGMYRRIPMDLSNAGADIPGTGLVGGHGGALDLFRPTTLGKSDILLAEPNPDALGPGTGPGILRLKGDNTQSMAFKTSPQGYDVPEEVEVNPFNGEIYVGAYDSTGVNKAAVLRYTNAGAFLEKIVLPNFGAPFCMVYDHRDAVAYYDLVAVGINGTKKIYLIDIDNDRPSGDRVKFLADAPSADAECDDLAISPAGALIYPSQTTGKLYTINLNTGATSLLANLPGVHGVAFISRSAFWNQDTGYAIGQFQGGILGPNGRPAVRVTVTDPEFSSGLVKIEATGSNLAVNGQPLPFVKMFDSRHEVTKFTFIAEKINASYGASIRVLAHDVAGLCGDPPLEMLVNTKSTDPVTISLEELQAYGTDKRVVTIYNNGVPKITLSSGGEECKLKSDAKMASGQTVDARGKKGVIKICEDGPTSVILNNSLSLTVTLGPGGGKPKGETLMIAVN